MFKRLDAIVEKYLELQNMLSTPEVLNDYNKLRELSKEKSDLEETYLKYEEYKKAKSDLEEAEAMKDDDYAANEYADNNQEQEQETEE